MGMSIPYEATGRRSQKERTRAALIEATRRLLATGSAPTVEESAAAASISRTTAYRYFANQRELLVAAHPEVDRTSLLPAAEPSAVRDRLDLVIQAFIDLTLATEAQLRATLWLSLDPNPGTRGQLPLRGGRAIGWITDALRPLDDDGIPVRDIVGLAMAIRSACGIESLVWLTDVAGQSRVEAAAMMRWSALSMLGSALDGGFPPTSEGRSRAPGVDDARQLA